MKINFGNKTITVKQTIPDKIINWYDPARGRKRLVNRLMSASIATEGNYTGGSTTKKSLKSWLPWNSDADSAIEQSIKTASARSSDLVRNCPLGAGAVNTVCTNAIGTGLKLHSRIDKDVLGLTKEKAEEWQTKTEREWKLLAETTDFDISRTLNFAAMQNLALRTELEKGDAFVLMPFRKRPGSPYGLKLQFVEADRVCNKNNQLNTKYLFNGVEKDKYGSPKAYHVLRAHPGNMYNLEDSYRWDIVKAFGEKTGRRRVIHLYKVDRPGQTRGVPYLIVVEDSLKMLDRFRDAELIAAVVAGNFTAFIKTAAGEFGIDSDDEDDGERDLSLGAGKVVGLGAGEDVAFANPSRPNAAFDPFVQAILRQVGVALQIPFEVLIGHFTASFSASRMANLAAWRFYFTVRKHIADNFCQHVYEAFLWEAVANGRIAAPGFFNDYLIRKAYLGSEWSGAAPSQVDPVKEAKASEIRRNAGFSTTTQETTMLNGGDFDKNILTIEKEQKLLSEAGLKKLENKTESSDKEDEKTDDKEES